MGDLSHPALSGAKGRKMSLPDLFPSLFRYKAWADEELHALAAALDGDAHPDKRHLAIRILNHIHVVDRIFAGNLTGRPHGYAGTNTPAPIRRARRKRPICWRRCAKPTPGTSATPAA